jgi:Tfp pilus assembly protein PilP
MKLLVHTLPSPANIFPTWRAVARDDSKPEVTARVPVANPRPLPSAVSGPVRTVVIIAFCHSLFFLALWLFLCASAGAATSDHVGGMTELKASTYAPKASRDPFFVNLPQAPAPAGENKLSAASTMDEPPPVAPVTMIPVTFELQGTLYQSGNSTALINGSLATLNKQVALAVGDRVVKIVPVEISRERVKIKAGETVVELMMDKPQVTVDLPESVFK